MNFLDRLHLSSSTQARRRLAARLGWRVFFAAALIFTLPNAISTQSDLRYLWPLSWALFFIVTHYLILQLLKTGLRRGALSIIRNGAPIDIRGWEILGWTWGLFWRFLFILFVLELFLAIVAIYVTPSATVTLVLAFVSAVTYSFGASAWLIYWKSSCAELVFSAEINNGAHNMANHNETAFDTAKRGVGAIFGTAAVVSYFAIGLIQLAAVFTFFEDYWGWWTIPSIIVGLFVAYMPLVGSIAGYFAATEIWDWKWYWAGLLFFFPLVLFVIVAAIDGISSIFRR